MNTLNNKYRTLFENEVLFSNIIKVYVVCKHGNECRIHYNNVCTQNIIGGVLIQPEESDYLQNCTVDMSTGRVLLNANIDRLNDRHRAKVFKWLHKHYTEAPVGRSQKIKCNFIIVSADNILEIIELLYRLTVETNFFSKDPTLVERAINNRGLFCKTRFKLSLS